MKMRKKNLREANQIHLKFVDDLTIAESIPLIDNLQSNPSRIFPVNHHDRTGHVLKPERSSVYQELENIQKYAQSNEMKLNIRKSKFMLFTNVKT